MLVTVSVEVNVANIECKRAIGRIMLYESTQGGHVKVHAASRDREEDAGTKKRDPARRYQCEPCEGGAETCAGRIVTLGRSDSTCCDPGPITEPGV